MKKKIIAYSLIVLGALPIIGKIIYTILARSNQTIIINNDFIVDLFSKYGAGIVIGSFLVGVILMVVGFYMLKKEKSRTNSEEDELNMNADENVVLKQVGSVSIVIITNKRVIFYGFFIDNLRKSIPNLPWSNKAEYTIDEIQSVKAINSNDLTNKKTPINAKWGIQLELKEGKIVNIPISEQDIVALHIDRLVKQKSW
jgi:hypothetical protein